MFDLILVGAGPSGIYASYLAQLHNLNVLILEASPDIGGQMKLFLDKPVFDMPGHLNIVGKNIMNLLSKQLYLNKTVNIFYEEEVIEIKGEVKNFIVKTKKNLYNAKTIIIATGGGAFKPMPLGFKNESSYKNIIHKIIDSKKYIGKKL